MKTGLKSGLALVLAFLTTSALAEPVTPSMSGDAPGTALAQPQSTNEVPLIKPAVDGPGMRLGRAIMSDAVVETLVATYTKTPFFKGLKNSLFVDPQFMSMPNSAQESVLAYFDDGLIDLMSDEMRIVRDAALPGIDARMAAEFDSKQIEKIAAFFESPSGSRVMVAIMSEIAKNIEGSDAELESAAVDALMSLSESDSKAFAAFGTTRAGKYYVNNADRMGTIAQEEYMKAFIVRMPTTMERTMTGFCDALPTTVRGSQGCPAAPNIPS